MHISIIVLKPTQCGTETAVKMLKKKKQNGQNCKRGKNTTATESKPANRESVYQLPTVAFCLTFNDHPKV